jgi:heterodisulfide reductase subunit B
MVKYASFLGCQIPHRLPSIEIAANKVFSKLNLETVDLHGYSCCPEPVVSRLLDETAWLATSARNLAIAEELNLNLMTLCNGCYETLVETNETLREDSEKMERVNAILRRFGKQYNGGVEVKHVVEVLYEDLGIGKIKENIVKPQDIRLALHYGCHMYREPDGGDIMRKPNMMKALVQAAGVKIVDYGLERLCCGYPSMQADEEFSLTQRLLPKLRSIEDSGAEAILFSCPACILQFEMGQISLRTRGYEYRFPCISIMEILALSFGFSPREIHLEMHRSPVMQFAQRIWRD